MYRLLLLLIICTVSSCQFFETEKLSKESIYEDELKTIDWSDVDQYPAFENCKNKIEKVEQKECFTNTLSSAIYDAINLEGYVMHQDINDTVLLTMFVEKSGKLNIAEIKMDSLSKATFPRLDSIIRARVDSLKIVNPAYKRAIPVKTEFKLPIILSTSSL